MARAGTDSTIRTRRGRRRAGVTLVELLVSIAVVAILSTLLVVILRQARAHANDAVEIADLRHAIGLMTMWSGDHGGRLLNVGMPRDPELGTVYFENRKGELMSTNYLGQEGSWARILEAWSGEPYPFRPNGAMWYTATLLTNPELWPIDPAPSTKLPAIPYWRILNMSDVAFPSAKGKLYRYILPPGSDPHDPPFDRHGIGFVDGSAGIFADNTIAPLSGGLRFGIRTNSVLPVFDTLHGANGFDVRR